MTWKRVIAYGVALWVIPFVASLGLFPIRDSNRFLFESLITVIGVGIAVAAAVLFFRKGENANIRAGLSLGFAWLAISVIIDLPIFLYVFQMTLRDYLADIALTYLSFPAITSGIAVARRGASWVK